MQSTYQAKPFFDPGRPFSLFVCLFFNRNVRIFVAAILTLYVRKFTNAKQSLPAEVTPETPCVRDNSET